MSGALNTPKGRPELKTFFKKQASGLGLPFMPRRAQSAVQLGSARKLPLATSPREADEQSQEKPGWVTKPDRLGALTSVVVTEERRADQAPGGLEEARASEERHIPPFVTTSSAAGAGSSSVPSSPTPAVLLPKRIVTAPPSMR